MTQPKLSYLNLYTTDPAWNLAAEQYVFDALPRDRTYFMLWQNDNAIIIGKHQNAAAEINQQFVRENGVRVVRRLSGGGAVYHDMGNLNFTFITDAGGSGTPATWSLSTSSCSVSRWWLRWRRWASPLRSTGGMT